jgi:SOS response regulatory protein OraA/RecX
MNSRNFGEYSNNNYYLDENAVRAVKSFIQKTKEKREKRQRQITQELQKPHRNTSHIPVRPYSEEFYEIVLSHLLDEGYAETLQAAEKIMVNMSEEWKSLILEGFVDLTPEKETRVKQRVGDLGRDVQVLGATHKNLGKKPLARFRPGIKGQRQEIAKTARKKAALVSNAVDALVRTSVSRESKIKNKIEKLKSKISELEPKNKIVRFHREDYEYIISYLVNEGYVNDYNSAEYMIENMSYEWLNNVLSEMPYQVFGPPKHGPSDAERVPIGKPYNFDPNDPESRRKARRRAKKRVDKLDGDIGGYRHDVREVP